MTPSKSQRLPLRQPHSLVIDTKVQPLLPIISPKPRPHTTACWLFSLVCKTQGKKEGKKWGRKKKPGAGVRALFTPNTNYSPAPCWVFIPQTYRCSMAIPVLQMTTLSLTKFPGMRSWSVWLSVADLCFNPGSVKSLHPESPFTSYIKLGLKH